MHHHVHPLLVSCTLQFTCLHAYMPTHLPTYLPTYAATSGAMRRREPIPCVPPVHNAGPAVTSKLNPQGPTAS